jgi:N6-L-threonylcarbamoyladenine synthase
VNVLGIETSCDENSVAVVRNGRELMSNIVFSQVDLHKIYGGVVPEVAARSHIEVMIPVIEEALGRAFPHVRSSGVRERKEETSSGAERTNVRRASNRASDAAIATSAGGVRGSAEKQASAARWAEIDAIAVAHGPGLGGSLLIGTLTARTLAYVLNKPLYGVHHALGHIYANFIDWTNPVDGQQSLVSGPQKTEKKRQTTDDWQEPKFPLLALIVSGGHSHLVLMKGHFDYRLLGQTQDDAVGEGFDKAAKILGLPYPGGPSIQATAVSGDPAKYPLPKAKLSGKYDFSFSGLKTALLRQAQANHGKGYDFPSGGLPELLDRQEIKDLAASFQSAAVGMLVDKTLDAYRQFKPKTVVIAGGVAANTELRRQLREKLPININYAPTSLCTDNGAMIAALGYYAAKHHRPDNPLALEINPSLSL